VKSIHLVLDFHSGIPIYLQIVEQIQKLAASGQLLPGDQLPTVRQLAAEIRVNFNTVARAYRMLDDAGLISTQQGRGTYLLEPGPENLERKIQEATLEVKIKRALGALAREGYDRQDILDELQKIIGTQSIEESVEDHFGNEEK